MVNLDQIKQLEARVSKAIELMQTLKDENDLLKLELHDRQQRIEELENIVLVFRNDQAKIEEGIINALNHLSAFEDTVYQAANSTAASAVHEAAPAANEAPEMQPTALNPTGAVASEQPNPIHEEASETQSPTAVAETVPQQAPQEPINHSNQLDIFLTMAERKGRLQIDLLGTSFALEADQPAEYLQSIYKHYKKVVSEVQQTSGVNDSLRIAIIAGILLSDELSKERLNPQALIPQHETEVLIEQSAKKMIEDIDSIIYSLTPSNDGHV